MQSIKKIANLRHDSEDDGGVSASVQSGLHRRLGLGEERLAVLHNRIGPEAIPLILFLDAHELGKKINIESI